MFKDILPKFNKKWLFYLLFALVLILGTVLRVHTLFHTHNIFYDEAALLLNFKERTYVQLFLPLDYNQCCPPLLLIAGKFIYEHFGLNLIALRLMPFIFSLISLFSFALLSLKIFKNKISVLLINFMFALSPWIFTYQLFLKQYVADIFTTIAILLCAYYLKDRQISRLSIILLSLSAILCILISYTSAIVIASVFIVLFFRKYNKQKRKEWLHNGLLFTVILALFLIPYYFINMKSTMRYQDFQDYWTIFTGAFYPKKIDDFKNITDILTGNMLYFSNVMIIAFISAILMYIKDKFTLFILFLPFVFSLILGLSGKYPFVPERTILFLIPLFLIIIIKPLDYCLVSVKSFIRDKKKKIIFAISLVFILFFVCSLNITEFKRINNNLVSGQFTNITDYIYEKRYKKERTSNVQAALKMYKKYGLKKSDYVMAKYADRLVFQLYDNEKLLNRIIIRNAEHRFNSLPIGTTIYMYISEEYDDCYYSFKNLLDNCEIQLSVEDGAYTLIKAKKIH